MQRTKIVCTLGPASDSLVVIEEMVRSGMDVARLNYSHGTQESHARLAELVRRAAATAGRQVALLQDLSGPKIRTGRLRERRGVQLRTGQRLWLTPEDVLGSSKRISISYGRLARDLRRGDPVLLDDGSIELRVLGTRGGEVEAEVIQGGLLRERKGVNLPGVALKVEALTPKDEADLRTGVALGVDYVALSFVRQAADVQKVKSLLHKQRVEIPVIAKLEKPEAVENLDAILKVSDGVMVARGDLGVEMPPEQVPLIQKNIIHKAAAARVPVITATQMLESMTVNVRPTRAEASDVANAIFDGTDAVMLSGETATGRYPVESVRMMARIAAQTDLARLEADATPQQRVRDIAETICDSVVRAARILNVKAIVAFTQSGSTARLISKYRPAKPVYAFCDSERVARRAALYWGVEALVLPLTLSAEATWAQAEAELLRRRLVSRNDIVAVVAGTPGKPGQTNQMKLVRVGAA